MYYNIRVATEKDAKELLEIYAPYVENTAISFEYEVPSVEEFQGRIRNTLRKYPYLIIEESGTIMGYAYAGPFKERSAYDRAVEMTIYLREDAKGKGYGKILYAELEHILKQQNITNVNACIGYPEVEDEYLTKNSVEFHTHLGYQMVGIFHNCGYKFERWYHMVWMEKMIAEHKEHPEEMIPFSKLKDIVLQK